MAKTCSIEGCEKSHKGRGWCSAHHTRWLRHGDPLGGGPAHHKYDTPTCSIEGCGGRHEARGLCAAHYRRWRQQSLALEPVNNPNSDKYPDRVFYWGRWRTPGQIERKVEQLRNRRRQQKGIPLDIPVMTRAEIGRIGTRRQRDVKIESDPKLLQIVHRGDTKAQKMIDLFLHPNTPEEERVVARDFLRKRRYIWRDSRTTSVETPTTQEGSRSQSSLAVTRGA